MVIFATATLGVQGGDGKQKGKYTEVITHQTRHQRICTEKCSFFYFNIVVNQPRYSRCLPDC